MLPEHCCICRKSQPGLTAHLTENRVFWAALGSMQIDLMAQILPQQVTKAAFAAGVSSALAGR